VGGLCWCTTAVLVHYWTCGWAGNIAYELGMTGSDTLARAMQPSSLAVPGPSPTGTRARKRHVQRAMRAVRRAAAWGGWYLACDSVGEGPPGAELLHDVHPRLVLKDVFYRDNVGVPLQADKYLHLHPHTAQHRTTYTHKGNHR